MPGAEPEPWSSLAQRHPSPPPPPPHLTLLTSRGALRPEEATPSKTSPRGHVRGPRSYPEGAAETSAGTVHCGPTRKRTTEQTERGRPHPNLSNHWHGHGEHLRTEHLRARQEKEEPRGHGSDYKVLWRRQKEEEQVPNRCSYLTPAAPLRVRSGVTRPPPPSSPPLGAGPMKTLWCTSSGASCPLLVLNPGGETPWAWPRRRVPRAQSRRSGDAETKAHCPGSSTCDALTRDQEKPSPVHPQNAGAPSSKPSAEDKAADPAGREEGEEQAADSQPLEMLTH